MQIALMLLMLGYQNTPRLIAVLVPNNCQAARSDVRPRHDKVDGRSRDNLRQFLVPKQHKHFSCDLCFVGLLSLHLSVNYRARRWDAKRRVKL